MTHSSIANSNRTERHAAIGVVLRDERLLVIERSQTVRAPGKFCFPGGEVEPGEHVAAAVVRELHEELSLSVRPIRQIWTSVAPSKCVLNWIYCQVVKDSNDPLPNPKEVAAVQWMYAEELAIHPKALPTNLQFLNALQKGQIVFPKIKNVS